MVDAFTGHVLVVGGRAVRMPPPGALAESAPKRAARAREGDSLFILITPTGDTHAPSAFFEELARLGADVYFSGGGGITGGLREALTAINTQVRAAPESESPLRVDALALVLRGEELYAARSGSAFITLKQGDELVFFPIDRADSLIMNLPPLGSGDTPEIQLARYRVAPGDVALLAGSDLVDADESALRSALAGENIPAVLDRLKPLAGEQAAASVIQFVPPGTPDPGQLAPPPHQDSKESQQSKDSADAPAPVRPMTRAPRPGSRTGSKPPIPRAASSESVFPADDEPTAQPAELPISPAVDPPAGADTGADSAAPMSDPIRDVLGKIGGLVRGGQREPSGGPSVIDRTSRTVRRLVRETQRVILAALLAVTEGFTRLLNFVLPTPDGEGRQGIPTNIAVGLAILIPVVIVVVVVGLALSEAGKTEFETYRDRAQSAHDEALELSGGTCENQALRPVWMEVLRLAEQAQEFRPNDTEAMIIKADAQNYLDCFDNVQRRDLSLLREFASNAELIGPIVGGGGVDLYTLDRANGVIYHDTLDTGGERLTTRDPDPIVRRNQAIGPHIVGDLFDIEWLSSGGTAHDNVLVALDTSGVLVSYSPTFFESAQQLAIEGRWQNPVAIGVFRSNLYVLDSEANQIWRYVPPIGERRYSNAPEEYFNGNLPDLSGAVDFGISEEGAIYILFADGTIRKYRRNEQSIVEEQPFTYQQRPTGAITGGTALFVDNDPASRQLYIVDAPSETIYETLWGGSFQSGYRPRSATGEFEDLTGFYADSVVRNNMYVLAGNRLYHFRRNP